MDKGSFINQLSCFGEPDRQIEREDSLLFSSCYFDLGLEFLPSTDNRIAYIYIYFQPGNRSVDPVNELSPTFSPFSGALLYGCRAIDVSELQDCHALIQSFDDRRFKLYDTMNYRDSSGNNNRSIAYIEEINKERKRTVVFGYRNNHINTVILY